MENKLKPCPFSEQDKTRIMAYDMLEGWCDFNGKILRDKIVRSRKPAKCMFCGIDIKPGTFVRSAVIVDRDDNEVLGAKLCQDCCSTLANAQDESVDFYERMDKFRTVGRAR